MKYYKDTNNKVHVLDDDRFTNLLPKGLVEIDEAEAIELQNPPESPEQRKEKRINFLKQSLTETDYIALTDYDKEKPDLVKQRQMWRDEIRKLENE